MERPYLPIAVGFYLLGLPLWGLAPFAERSAETWTYLAVGGVLIAAGALLHGRSR